MTNISPEPWHIKELDNADHQILDKQNDQVGCEDNCINDEVKDLVVDAERIVLCVNACMGLCNENLQLAIDSGGLAKMLYSKPLTIDNSGLSNPKPAPTHTAGGIEIPAQSLFQTLTESLAAKLEKDVYTSDGGSRMRPCELAKKLRELAESLDHYYLNPTPMHPDSLAWDVVMHAVLWNNAPTSYNKDRLKRAVDAYEDSIKK